MSTFVSVGNARDRFTRLLDAVGRLAQEGALPEPVLVQHGCTPFTSDRCISRDFLSREEFASELERAQLVITHGGLTVFRALHAGKVPVVVPRQASHREHIDDHQLDMIRTLAEGGSIEVVLDVADLGAAVRRALQRQESAPAAERSLREPPLVSEIRDLLSSWS